MRWYNFNWVIFPRNLSFVSYSNCSIFNFIWKFWNSWKLKLIFVKISSLRSYRILFITFRIRKRAAMSRTKWLSNFPRRRRQWFHWEMWFSWNSFATRWRCSIRCIESISNRAMAGTRSDFIHRFHCDFYRFKKIVGNHRWISKYGCKWLGTNEYATNIARSRAWNLTWKMEGDGESWKNSIATCSMCSRRSTTIRFKCDLLFSISRCGYVVGLQQSTRKVKDLLRDYVQLINAHTHI